MSPFVAEVLGTMILILLGNGVVANVLLKDTKGHDSGWIVITVGWGLAVFAGVVIAGPFSGAHLNPAVTIGLATAGLHDWAMVLPYVAAQMIGAMVGAVLVYLTYLIHYQRTTDAAAILATFSTGPAVRHDVYNVITEAIGTFVLLFCVFYFAEPSITAQGITDGLIGLGSIGALPVALIVVAIGLSLGGPTGYAINPARDLAPRLAHALLPIPDKGDSDWSYAWIPIIGPILGAVIAAGLFLVLA